MSFFKATILLSSSLQENNFFKEDLRPVYFGLEFYNLHLFTKMYNTFFVFLVILVLVFNLK